MIDTLEIGVKGVNSLCLFLFILLLMEYPKDFVNLHTFRLLYHTLCLIYKITGFSCRWVVWVVYRPTANGKTERDTC